MNQNFMWICISTYYVLHYYKVSGNSVERFQRSCANKLLFCFVFFLIFVSYCLIWFFFRSWFFKWYYNINVHWQVCFILILRSYYTINPIWEGMVAYFCHHLSDNYLDLSGLYVDLSGLYVDLSDLYVDLSLIPSIEK